MVNNIKKAIIFFAIFTLFSTSCSRPVSSRGSYQKDGNVQKSLSDISKPSAAWATASQAEQAQKIELENSKYKVVFDTKGASVSSIVLKEWSHEDKPLELILKNYDSDRAFLTYPGKDLSRPLLDVFNVTKTTDDSITFEKKYTVDGIDTTLRKTFELSDEYMIRLSVDVDAASPLSSGNGYLYSVSYGPSLGPSLLSNSKSVHNERKFLIYRSGDKKTKTLNFNGDKFEYTGDYKFFELTGRYFTLIAAPASPKSFHLSAVDNTKDTTCMFVSRVAEDSASSHDEIYYYLGPHLTGAMKAFDFKEHNKFALSDMNFSKAIQRGGSFAWLQSILNLIMSLFYKLIPNWGVAIVFLTLFVKFLLFPLYKKSMRSSQAMSKIAPELDNLKRQYKDNPEMLNRATLELYKKHKISPTSSLVPLLIQFPVLLAMYGLLNNRFELREAVFIPGWIDDLSSPDTVFTLPFSLPLLGNEIHILPFVYFLSMMLSMIVTRAMGQSQNQSKRMHIFMYVIMPVFFFFILYNTPSGLLVYWTIANIFSIIQQVIMNKTMKNEGDSTKNDRESHRSKGPLYNPNLPPKAKK